MSDLWIPLNVDDVDPDPFAQFQRWFDDAQDRMADREAVALVSATSDGRPSARMVLLRHHDATSFGWYTNYNSRKGHELIDNPQAALLWYCEPLGRQIRIEGDVEEMPAAMSDAYFATRARGSQLGAHASAQSQPLASRAALEERVAELERRYDGVVVPRPENWGGFLLMPSRFEYWQHRDDRLHDRVVYLPDTGSWRRERLSP